MAKSHQPKYQEVQEYLLSCIRQGQLLPGQRAPSENELSRQFQISRLTARHALTSLVNSGILKRQQGSGTFVRERNRRIGVCMTYIDTYIFPDILRGIDEILRQNQVTLVLTCSNNDPVQEKQVLANLLEQNLDGLIWEPARSALIGQDDVMLAQVRQSRLPAVLINSPLPFAEAGQVLTADAAGMGLLAGHLTSLGHRRFAGIFCRDLIQGARRQAGLTAALAQSGLVIEPQDLLWFDYRDLAGDFDQLARPWLEQLLVERITALCCYNDQVAQRCSLLLHEIGCQIPEMMSVTGFDAVERLYPPGKFDYAPIRAGLTTVTHPCAQLGRQAAAMLLEMIAGQPAGKPAPPCLEMPAELVIGGSTSRPPPDPAD